MTFIDTTDFPRGPLVPGGALDRINSFFSRDRAIGTGYLDPVQTATKVPLGPVEERLRIVQETISAISMHLPSGFARGLNRQFANLMDEDAWEEDDDLVSTEALTTFLVMLVRTQTKKRPGIGTNGRGSVTAAWTLGNNRLTIECLSSGRATIVLSRVADDGEIERAAFESIRPERICSVLGPFDPEVWFDL